MNTLRVSIIDHVTQCVSNADNLGEDECKSIVFILYSHLKSVESWKSMVGLFPALS